MGRNRKKILQDVIDDIPDAKLQGFPDEPGTLYHALNLRLDIQGITSNYKCNLQVQVNRRASTTSLRPHAPKTVAEPVLVPPTSPGRKRKVKCQLTDKDVDTCAECIKSGTQCTIEAPDTDENLGSSPSHAHKKEYDSRLERIESLLRKLVDAHEQQSSSSAQLPTASSSIWNDFLLNTPVDDILSLADDRGLATPQQPETPDAKKSLVALLPSEQDAVTIVTNSTAWRWGAENPPGSVLKSDDTMRLLETATISRGSAIHVAKTLLLFALYMQQLPSTFDMQLSKCESVEKAIELIVEQVGLFMLSNEDDTCTLDGLECLTLLSLIPLNDAAIRKAWMAFRRVLDVSRLNGLQNSFSLSARNSSSSDMALRRRLWLSAACGDCYCSLLLGLEPGVGLEPFGPQSERWSDPSADDDANVQRRICLIMVRIAQRNVLGLHHDRHILQDIDMALNELQDPMLSDWWKIPSFREGRSLDSAKEPNRLVCQLWFLQAQIFTHMPIAFGKAAAEAIHSLDTCIEASRFTLNRYIGLLYARDQLSRCRTVDQAVFFAAVVLILAKVQVRHLKMPFTASKYDSDRALVEQVVDSFEAVGKISHREHVGRDIFHILSSLLNISGSQDLFSKDDSSCNSEVFGGSHLATSKSGMEDIIASSIQPVLDPQSPASHLIAIFLATSRFAPAAPNNSQELSPRFKGIGFDDFIDTTLL
ncbi:uncharacterized protein TRUGW13939_07506 [Talaromyces rugulosus]|uniref:Xylanolytic transcriptional activator regulatory domain-containing protein n=1 Tax=Talaromyces rugulosus TaxID=121627 RepID=A0A7H8R3W3_TALRU|nr:uncharacterized protein TRUGW13939_07506 [Talaromyces rugulosus]QKX60361.1 hypothetical protein TRUGW13939_07506 [Talaromyces rugulosus]